MHNLINRIRLFISVLTGIARPQKFGFLLTTFYCASWRILTIAAYAFALKTLIDVYQVAQSNSETTGTIGGLLLVIAFFAVAGCFDVLYTGRREQLNANILSLLEHSRSQDRPASNQPVPPGTDNAHAMLVTKTFDAFLGLILFVTGLLVIGLISISIFLIFLTMLPVFALLYYLVKRSFSLSVSSALISNNRINYNNLRLRRAAIYRFVSQLSAGIFVAVLCLYILDTGDISFSVLQVAILGFSVRFSISFLSLFLLNSITLLDRIDVLRYFAKISVDPGR